VRKFCSQRAGDRGSLRGTILATFCSDPVQLAVAQFFGKTLKLLERAEGWMRMREASGLRRQVGGLMRA